MRFGDYANYFAVVVIKLVYAQTTNKQSLYPMCINPYTIRYTHTHEHGHNTHITSRTRRSKATSEWLSTLFCVVLCWMWSCLIREANLLNIVVFVGCVLYFCVYILLVQPDNYRTQLEERVACRTFGRCICKFIHVWVYRIEQTTYSFSAVLVLIWLVRVWCDCKVYEYVQRN